MIGNPVVQQPRRFAFMPLPVNPMSPQVMASPTYTVDQIRILIGGNSFFMGIDISQAPRQGPYPLDSFLVNIGGTDEFLFTGP